MSKAIINFNKKHQQYYIKLEDFAGLVNIDKAHYYSLKLIGNVLKIKFYDKNKKVLNLKKELK